MPGISDMFRPTQQMAVVPANPMAQNNPAAGAPPPPAGAAAPTVAQPEPANPMDTFSSLWQHDPNAKPQVDPTAAPVFNTDPAKIHESAAKMDFLAKIPQDLMAKAMSGSDPAAFMQVINAVAQNTLATATQLSTATAEHGARTATQRLLQALPDRVKQINLDAIAPENPALQHPAAQPILQLARQQIRTKNPHLSAQQINAMAEKYVSEFAGSIAQPAQASSGASGESGGAQDWEKFLN